jgi:hypothetical protein
MVSIKSSTNSEESNGTRNKGAFKVEAIALEENKAKPKKHLLTMPQQE